MESHGSPPAMDGMLPKEPGQPALSPMDVEPTSENVRTFDASVSSRLRSARCGSIASGTNPLDHMSAQVADDGTCQSNSFPPGFIRAFPRGLSLNGCKDCLEQFPIRSLSRSRVAYHSCSEISTLAENKRMH